MASCKSNIQIKHISLPAVSQCLFARKTLVHLFAHQVTNKIFRYKTIVTVIFINTFE